MTLEDRISALAALYASHTAAKDDARQAEDELRRDIIEAVRKVMPHIANTFESSQMSPAELAATASDLIDRQLAGNLSTRTDELRAEAALLRALAGAVRGMKAARAGKK